MIKRGITYDQKRDYILINSLELIIYWLIDFKHKILYSTYHAWWILRIMESYIGQINKNELPLSDNIIKNLALILLTNTCNPVPSNPSTKTTNPTLILMTMTRKRRTLKIHHSLLPPNRSPLVPPFSYLKSHNSPIPTSPTPPVLFTRQTRPV